MKTLLDVYLLSSNFAILINQKKKRQPGRSLVMTIQSSAPIFGRGGYCISSLTWASCVAYPSGRQRRPDDGVSKSKTPTSFFCIRSERGAPACKQGNLKISGCIVCILLSMTMVCHGQTVDSLTYHIHFGHNFSVVDTTHAGNAAALSRFAKDLDSLHSIPEVGIKQDTLFVKRSRHLWLYLNFR